ncbi:hypothetical protein GCM10009743_44960 [Kribbella swartbergensis]
MGVAIVVAPEVGAASVPHADRAKPIRTTAGPKCARHLAPRLTNLMLGETRQVWRIVALAVISEYLLASGESTRHALD